MAETKPAAPTTTPTAPPTAPPEARPVEKKAKGIKVRRAAKKRKTIKTIAFRRRRLNVTDYKKRLALLSSRKPRLVTRVTNRRAIAQIVVSDPDNLQDKTVVCADSIDLKNIGLMKWRKSTGACYLVGLMCGARASASGTKEAVLDFGLRTPTHGGRVFAILKGAIDGGLKIPHDPVVFPKEERLVSKIGAEEFKKLRDTILAGTKVKEKKIEKKEEGKKAKVRGGKKE